MVNYRGAWDREQVAAFLAETVVPVRLACRTPAGRLWMLSLWFRPDTESLQCATAADADVVRYLRADGEVAFEVSTNEPPYRGVRGNGTATVSPDEDKQLLVSLVGRYLGGTDSQLAGRLLGRERPEVELRIEPRSVYSWDFTDRMRDV
jgi:nitroimidazol reductase NimA-like FMN-containing flavoprotein (pyridoxamine 5'-phosphate oxidase superfamily)